MWDSTGTDQQKLIIAEALKQCDFPFGKLAVSLLKERKSTIAVNWEDLSRFSADTIAAQQEHNDHGHGHHLTDGGQEVSPIIREVDGRARVLGLFYLPPYTRIVLDTSLTGNAPLAREVFLAEAAHAVDYHFMTNEHRRAVWNAIHEQDTEDLPAGATVPDSGDVDHGHSWFDGPGGYSTWVGEAFMEGFTRAFAPAVRITIQLSHPVSPAAAAKIRHALVPPPEQKQPAAWWAFLAALRRFIKTRACPAYLRKAAGPVLVVNDTGRTEPVLTFEQWEEQLGSKPLD